MTNNIPIDNLSPLFVFRFWTHVEQSGECRVWTASTDPKGYGSVKLNKRFARAHRVAYTIANGPIPEGLVIDHLCRNRACVNPEHLEAVTNQENIRRGIAAGFGPGRPKATVCKSGHEFTETNTIIVSKGKRCRTCLQKHKRDTYDRKLAAQGKTRVYRSKNNKDLPAVQ